MTTRQHKRDRSYKQVHTMRQLGVRDISTCYVCAHPYDRHDGYPMTGTLTRCMDCPGQLCFFPEEN